MNAAGDSSRPDETGKSQPGPGSLRGLVVDRPRAALALGLLAGAAGLNAAIPWLMGRTIDEVRRRATRRGDRRLHSGWAILVGLRLNRFKANIEVEVVVARTSRLMAMGSTDTSYRCLRLPEAPRAEL